MISVYNCVLRALRQSPVEQSWLSGEQGGVWKGRSPPSDNSVPGVSAQRKIFIKKIYMHIGAFLTAGGARMGGRAPKGIHVFPGP